jgi:hypothetical protein
MEIKKISLFSPESLKSFIDTRVLSDEEKTAILAGGVDGYCYFYCLEYLTQLYNCSDMSVASYVQAYASTYNESLLVGGGISDMSRIQDFTFSYFNTSTVDMSNMSSFLTGGNTILAGFSTGPDSDHAVIITGYNSETGKYKYKDPTTGDEQEKSASEFRFGLGITGCAN